MNRVLQPRPLVVLGLNVWMGTAAGTDELVEVPYHVQARVRTVVGRTQTEPPCISSTRASALES